MMGWVKYFHPSTMRYDDSKVLKTLTGDWVWLAMQGREYANVVPLPPMRNCIRNYTSGMER